MHVDVLVAEIGSTTTLLNGFTDIDSHPKWIGQGMAPTTVSEGDVCRGLEKAASDLARKNDEKTVTCNTYLATSSAAGGLGMSVHGLVYDMTVKAAKAAALGAGAVIRQTTAGKLTQMDLDELKAVNPKIILLSGGTDYGERETAVYNAHQIASLALPIPVIYAGNCQNQKEIVKIFSQVGCEVFLTDNVYPKLDQLNIEPARGIIQKAFEEHIVSAPGMQHIRELVNGEIMPTPGAVMEASQLLYKEIGDLVTIDVGGATTDVHSVTPGSEELALISTSPEPTAKRTVEGDLGLYVNAHNLVDLAKNQQVPIDPDVDEIMKNYLPIPQTKKQFSLTSKLCELAGLTALKRHAGSLRYIYTPQGRRTLVEGKDLTMVKHLIATGGALTKLPTRREIMEYLANCNAAGLMLYPRPNTLKVHFDNNYIMASVGVMSKRFPQAALSLLQDSFNAR